MSIRGLDLQMHDSLDDIVNSSFNPEVAVRISCRSVTEEEEALVGSHISVQVPLVVFVHRSGDRRPVSLGNQDTLDIVTLEHFS